MKCKFLDKKIDYIGSQLAPHWIYKNFNIQGDVILSFCGAADVKLTEMVDIEDVINNEPIYSEKMLHFIVEHFHINLVEGVYRQRMLVVIAQEAIEQITGKKLIRKGDDLFFNNKKLSVSIATKSMTSVLIHFAMNITNENTPIPTSGLESDLEIKDIENLAKLILKNYKEETDDILNASYKVRGV